MKDWPSTDYEFGGADPLVRGRRPRRPAGALQDADVVPAAGRGRPARSRGSAPPSNGVVFRPWRGLGASVSLADETVDFVDGTSVTVGDDGQDFAPVAETGGVFHELVVDALEELEILGVIDEEVIRLGDGDRKGVV